MGLLSPALFFFPDSRAIGLLIHSCTALGSFLVGVFWSLGFKTVSCGVLPFFILLNFLQSNPFFFFFLECELSISLVSPCYTIDLANRFYDVNVLQHQRPPYNVVLNRS